MRTESEFQIGKKTEYDLFLFSGQSNMAGRGEAELAPIVQEGAGFEFKAISDPTRLYPITEPFGILENDAFIHNLKNDNVPLCTGSMVSSFVNAYYESTQVPVIAISAAQGGTSTSDWLTKQQEGALIRLARTREWLETRDYSIRHIFVLWCQGETDGDRDVPVECYKENMNQIVKKFLDHGIEKLFMVQIGHCNQLGSEKRYQYIIDAQAELACTNPDIVMVSTDFSKMKDRGLMKDDFHYYQAAYNEVGTIAGRNAAKYFI